MSRDKAAIMERYKKLTIYPIEEGLNSGDIMDTLRTRATTRAELTDEDIWYIMYCRKWHGSSVILDGLEDLDFTGNYADAALEYIRSDYAHSYIVFQALSRLHNDITREEVDQSLRAIAEDTARAKEESDLFMKELREKRELTK